MGRKILRVPRQTLDVYADLLLFLHKYDCTATLCSFRGEILKLVNFDAIEPLDGFSLGAIAADKDLCAASLSMIATSGEGNVIHINTIEAFVWERAEPRYMFALTKTKHAFEVEHNDDPLAKTFHYYLDVARTSMFSMLQDTESVSFPAHTLRSSFST